MYQQLICTVSHHFRLITLYFKLIGQIITFDRGALLLLLLLLLLLKVYLYVVTGNTVMQGICVPVHFGWFGVVLLANVY